MNNLFKFNSFIKESYELAIKKYPQYKDIIEYVSNNINKKGFINDVITIYDNTINYSFSNFDISDILVEFEYYIETKTYLKLYLEKVTFDTLKKRNSLFRKVKDVMPKLFIINNKEIRDNYLTIEHNLNYLVHCYNIVSHINDDILKKVNSIVCSSNKSLEDIIDFLEDKDRISSLGKPITKYIIDNIEELSDGAIDGEDILWYQKNKCVIKITSKKALEFIGSNSFWCHVIKGANNFYNEYTRYGEALVFIKIDDNSSDGLCITVPNFYSAVYNDEFERYIDLYRNDNIDELSYDDIYTDMIYDKNNHPLTDPISFLDDFFGEDIDIDFLNNILDL